MEKIALEQTIKKKNKRAKLWAVTDFYLSICRFNLRIKWA